MDNLPPPRIPTHTQYVPPSVSAPPAPSKPVVTNDTYAWLAGLIPLGMIALRHEVRIDFVTGTIIAFIIATVLTIRDQKELERCGVRLDVAGISGITLVPVYLFQRAAKLQTSYGPAVCWVVTFLLSWYI